MKVKKELTRVNINMNPTVKDWYMNYSIEHGMTMSSLMNIALVIYMQDMEKGNKKNTK